MSENVIAKRYAGALLDAADAAKADVVALIVELNEWVEWLHEGQDGAQALLSPVLAPEQQAGFLNALLEQANAHPLVRGLLNVCLDKRRLVVLDRIVNALQSEVDQRSGVTHGLGTSAKALDDQLKSKIAEKVGALLNKKTEIEWREDASLLGGFKVQVGQTVWNASLQHQLNRLEDSIRKGAM